MSKQPFITIYLDGPFYKDPSLNKKDAIKKIRNEVYSAMCMRANASENYEYIKYVKKNNIAD